MLEQHDLLYPAAGVCLIFHRCFTGVCVCVCVPGCVCTSGQTATYATSQEGKKALFDLIQSRDNTLCVCVGVSLRIFVWSEV